MTQSVNQIVRFKDEHQGQRQIDIISCLPTGPDKYKLSGIIWDASPKRQESHNHFRPAQAGIH